MGWMHLLQLAREIYRYREMCKNLVARDLRARYKASILGFLWTFLNPLLMLVVYTVLFSTIVRIDIEHYPIFLFTGLLPWFFFQNSVQRSAVSVILNANMVKKIYFPRELLPITMVISGLVNFLLSLIILLAGLLVYGILPDPGPVLIYFVPVTFALFLLSLGAAFVVSALTVYMRDLEHILNVVMMAWFYLTPVLYDLPFVPEEYRGWFGLNPITPFIDSYRLIFLHSRAPDPGTLLTMTLTGLVSAMFGVWLFGRLKRGFLDEI